MAYIRCLHWHLLLIRTGIFLLSCKREKPQARYLKGTEGRDCNCGGAWEIKERIRCAIL